MKLRRPKLFLTAALIALSPVAALAAGGASTAMAAAATHPSSVVFHLKAAKAAKAAPVIECNLVVHYPHNSSHVHGTVNVVAQTKCSERIASISMGVVLSDNHGRYGLNNPKKCHFVGTASGSCNAALSCKTGNYTGYATAYLVAPPGYKPPTAIIQAHSKTVHIKC